ALQVAVDDEVEIVELFESRHVQHAAALGLVELSVAEERPGLLLGGVLDAPIVQVLVELRLLDLLHLPQAHGQRGVLPQVRELARVRAGRQALGLAVDEVRLLLTEAVELLGAHPAFEVGASIHAGGGVTLVEDVVAAAGRVLAAEEVVEPDLIESRRGGIGGDVAADLDTRTLSAMDEHGGIPSVPSTLSNIDLFIAGERGFVLRADGVDVVGGSEARYTDLLLT